MCGALMGPRIESLLVLVWDPWDWGWKSALNFWDFFGGEGEGGWGGTGLV